MSGPKVTMPSSRTSLPCRLTYPAALWGPWRSGSPGSRRSAASPNPPPAQTALALAPATTSAYRLLAQISAYKGRYDLALGQIDRAQESNPSDSENYLMRGTVLVYAGRAEQAATWLEIALRFDRASP